MKGDSKNRRGVEGGAPHSVKMWGVFNYNEKLHHVYYSKFFACEIFARRFDK